MNACTELFIEREGYSKDEPEWSRTHRTVRIIEKASSMLTDGQTTLDKVYEDYKQAKETDDESLSDALDWVWRYYTGGMEL